MIDFNEISAISKTWNYRKTEDRNGAEDSFTIPEYSEKLKLKKIGGKSVVWNQLVNEGAVLTVTGRKYLSKSADVFSIINGGQSVSVDKLIDLTKLFGAGNEPTSTTDPRIAAIKKYLETHPEYNEGEIIDSLVDEIEVDGVNLFDESEMFSDFEHTDEGYKCVNNSLYAKFKDEGFPIDYKENTQYFIRLTSKVEATATPYLEVKYTDGTRSTMGQRGYAVVGQFGTDTLVTTANKTISMIRFNYGTGANVNVIIAELMICEGSTAHPYKPYTAPKIIATNFPSLKSTGSVYDYIDFTSAVKLDDGNYSVNVVRNVGSVDLGSLNWSYNGNNLFLCYLNDLSTLPNYSDFITIKYNTVVYSTGWNSLTDKQIKKGNVNNQIGIKDLSYTTTQEFKQAIQGQILYYELATPTTETITISAELLEWLKVEYGGNMYYNQDGLSLPIPNTTSIHKHVEKTEELAQIVIDDEIVWSAPVSMFNLYDDEIIIDDDETSVNEDEVIDNE